MRPAITYLAKVLLPVGGLSDGCRRALRPPRRAGARDHPDPRRRHPRRRRRRWARRAGATSCCCSAPCRSSWSGMLHVPDPGQGRAGPRRIQSADLLERLHHDLRVLDRYRPRGHADLGDPVPVPLALAHRGVPLHRGDDGVRGHDRRRCSRSSTSGGSGSSTGCCPIPNQRFLWPNFKSPLLWDVFAISTYLTVSTTFLVFGLIPDVAAVRDKVTGWRQVGLYARLGRLAGHRQPVAALLPGLPLPGRAGDAAGALGALGGVAGTSRRRIVPGWHGTIFAPVLRGRRHLLRHRHGAHPDHPAPAGAQDRAHDHRVPLRQPGQADPADRLDPVLRLRDGVLRRLVQRQHLRADHLLPARLRPHVVGRLDDDHLQRVRLPAALVPEDPDQPHRRCSSSRSSSTSGCGSSAT